MRKIITIFGSTGNLMYKKLIPALSALIEHDYLQNNTKIYCVARKDCDLEDYIQEAKREVTAKVNWDKLIPFLTYIKLDVYNLEDYFKLNETINSNGINIDKIFYLAVPPSLFPVIAKGISNSKLIEKNDEFSRIVFEKPFGEDLPTAKAINKELWKYFDESQIYRIDHYLGKEMIQNILIVRFANIIFEKTWNRETIESIVIIVKENEGVLRRGGYYDSIGALKDMIQSHLMQMVALTTMEKPKTFNSHDVKNEKVKVIKKLRIEKTDVLLGQYKGYLDEVNIKRGSLTETFVYAKAFIDNSRWNGVPIHLITGKKLDEKRSEIIINFKSESTGSFSDKNNKLIIKVAPEEGVNFIFNVKEAGLNNKVVSSVLDYCHACKTSGNTPEAYEKLLLDIINKQDSLFTRWDEIETSWKIIDDIKNYHHEVFVYDDFNQVKLRIKDLIQEVVDDL